VTYSKNVDRFAVEVKVASLRKNASALLNCSSKVNELDRCDASSLSLVDGRILGCVHKHMCSIPQRAVGIRGPASAPCCSILLR
jgi:S-adenosylhomocysteine hydrolase